MIRRDDVLAALRAEDVASHLGIKGTFRGRWMRSRRCGTADHATEAFGLARDGHWRCHACDSGGDLLKLLAIGSGISIDTEFPKLLALAAQIAGVDDEDSFEPIGTKPAPRERPPLPPEVPLADRIAKAKKRAAWLWDQLYAEARLPVSYLNMRGLDAAFVLGREEVRSTPMRLQRPAADASPDLVTLWGTMRALAIVVPVRAVDGGGFVDLRARRVEPEPDRPKIIGMLGGVTAGAAEQGRARQLVGCYGHPECVDSDLVVVVEGLMDYLTALQVWPNAQILGAVEAGSMSLVAGHAARALARRDDYSRLIIVEQFDPPRTLRDGTVVPGAADAAINEDPNAAMKVAHRHLGPSRVGWLHCAHGTLPDGSVVKDLNDLVRQGADIGGLVVDGKHWIDPTPE